jgi:hypothetical protein
MPRTESNHYKSTSHSTICISGSSVKLTTKSSQNLLFEISIQNRGEQTFSPSSPEAVFPSSLASATPGSLKIIHLTCLAPPDCCEPTDVLHCKNAVCGLNGLSPTLRVGASRLFQPTQCALSVSASEDKSPNIFRLPREGRCVGKS